MAPFESITVAFDGSDSAINASSTARSIAEKFHSRVTLIAVDPTPLPSSTAPRERNRPDADAADNDMAEALDRERARLEKLGVSDVRTKRLQGPVVDAILEEVTHHPPDLLVVGARGLTTTGRIFLGSVSDGVVHHVHCPVLVVKPPAPK